MSQQPSVLVNRFDHIEFATLDASNLEALFERLGFVTTQTRDTAKSHQILMVQGQVRFLISQGQPGTFAHTYATRHGDGVCSLAYHSENCAETYKEALKRGATSAEAVQAESQKLKSDEIRVVQAAITSFGDVRATFVERSGTWNGRPLGAFDVDAPFGANFVETGKKPAAGCGFLSVDHLTNNVGKGEMDLWADFYKKIYGWVEARRFDIQAESTGLLSKVMQSPDGAVKVPINEPKEDKSQIQEFLERHRGAGVQHIALVTSDIRSTVKKMSQQGFQFLDVPDTYYEEVPTRVKNLAEPIPELKAQKILADGDDKGYLLQIFTQDQIGPLFFEVIQRKNHNGFGEGNFRALFEAIERDQKRRGVL
jgi:4-hydroxyphenylpyruvate dioxygenase